MLGNKQALLSESKPSIPLRAAKSPKQLLAAASMNVVQALTLSRFALMCSVICAWYIWVSTKNALLETTTNRTTSELYTIVTSNNKQVEVENYGFDGKTLFGTLWVQNIAYEKSLKIVYSTTDGNWNNALEAVYREPSFDGYEIWEFSAAVPLSIAQFYVEYKTAGGIYYDNNDAQNYVVTLPPSRDYCIGSQYDEMNTIKSGFQSDITEYFSAAIPHFIAHLFKNINPEGTARGVVVAAPQNNTVNNYFFHWIRDSALVMKTVNQIYMAQNTRNKTLERLFFDFQNITYKMQNENANTGLGEAKFNVDGSDYTGDWCRPQDDGPALRATTFMQFANQYLSVGGSSNIVKDMWQNVILADLNYVVSQYTNKGCDLWEEVVGIHFWTFGAQRKAIHTAAKFASSATIGDPTSAARFYKIAKTLDGSYSKFQTPGSLHFIKAVLRGNNAVRIFDAAVPLGAIHNDNGDNFFSPTDSRVLTTIHRYVLSMKQEYPLNTINTTNARGLPLAVAVGRYSGDVYDGSGTSAGNPWYIANAAIAELVYRAAGMFTKVGCVNVDMDNVGFFNGEEPAGLGLSVSIGSYGAETSEFADIVGALELYGDLNVRRIQNHGAENYHLHEQFHRETGIPQGVSDLTWSYSALITAQIARNELLFGKKY
ncbi:glycoside hydrolase 15 protein [Physocladia obscura]|uniref:glucan 1,4-alpha-glucosidase n=1 Tax=Physocladia obscura TaxID=109957 RepID=A0AAD5T7A6_9FUNG|nr:glycoside hydrolase 15 protein [Physocladia obscura]